MSAPSAKRGDSVKFVRPYATPTKKLNLRFFQMTGEEKVWVAEGSLGLVRAVRAVSA